MDVVDRASWQPMPRANRNNLIEPEIFRRPCFELRADAKVILGRIDGLTARKPLHHFGRPVAHAPISHEYKLRIIRPQSHTHIKQDDAIPSNEHCIRPTRENLPLEAWLFKFAAFNRKNAAIARRGITGIEFFRQATL